jgi:hypothetical protein
VRPQTARQNNDSTRSAIHEEPQLTPRSVQKEPKAKPPKGKPVCHKGVNCTVKDCKYDHPDGINPPTDCKYGINCKNKDTTCGAIHEESKDDASENSQRKAKHPKAKPVCHKGVNCTVKDCKYNHPDGINPCKNGLNCKNKDTTCGAKHEESKDDVSDNSQRKAKPPKAKPVCHKGVNCTVKDCKYDHPDGINPPTDCKYGPNCKNKDTTCGAIHRAIDDPERKITYHVDLPNAPNMSLKESIEPLLPKL